MKKLIIIIILSIGLLNVTQAQVDVDKYYSKEYLAPGLYTPFKNVNSVETKINTKTESPLVLINREYYIKTEVADTSYLVFNTNTGDIKVRNKSIYLSNGKQTLRVIDFGIDLFLKDLYGDY